MFRKACLEFEFKNGHVVEEESNVTNFFFMVNDSNKRIVARLRAARMTKGSSLIYCIRILFIFFNGNLFTNFYLRIFN